MIIIAAVQAAQWVFNFQQIFGLSIKWLPAVSLPIFLAVVIWAIWDLCKKIEESENKKPSISVTPMIGIDIWYLEVTNNGEKGIFTAQICLIEKEDNRADSKLITMGSRYNALWGKTNTDKSEIMNGHSDIVKLASIIYPANAKYFEVKAYDTINNRPYSVKHIEFDGFRDHVRQLNMQVVISSDPSLRGGRPFIREYGISLNGISESKPKKRISTPDKYMLGEEDESEDKYFDAKIAVGKLKSLKIYDDSSPGDLINVFYHLRDKLAVGLSEYEASVQDKRVLTQLNLHKIVQLEQRRKSSGPRMYDEGYWILTELGKSVVLYLETNKQVLDKEGPQI